MITLKFPSVILMLLYWDRLGPGTLGCIACTWTNVSLSNKIQRNYKGLKITVYVQLGQILDNNIQKDPKSPTVTSEEPGAKTGCREQKQGTAHAPCTQHHQGHLSHPSGPTPGHTPTLTSYKEPACLHLGVGGGEQGKLLLVFTPPCCSRGPNKALPEFLVWPLINFYWLKKTKNTGKYQY